jgi:diaminopimelate decarboxylase
VIPDQVAAALHGVAPPVCAYVYLRAALRDAVGALRAALPAGTLLCYAVKANGHPEVVGTLAEVADGLEVASGGELQLATAALAGAAIAGAARPAPAATTGCDTPLVFFAGPAKTDTELAAAVAAGAVLNVESALELRRLALLAGAGVQVCLRVNRLGAVPAGSHSMTGAPTPFGIAEAALDETAALASSLPGIRIRGYHLHGVSNNLDAAAQARFICDAVDWAAAAALRHGIEPHYLNVGGGLGVDHTGVRRFDLDALRAGLRRLVLPAGARLVVEPGRYLAAGAGWYAAEVLDLKYTHGRWFAVLRGGTHHFRLPAAWGYSHPFTVLPVSRWAYPFPRPQVRDVEVDAVGELCTPRDVLTRGQRVDRLRVGDLLVFARTGAYGWEVSHHGFLRHPHPRFLVV